MNTKTQVATEFKLSDNDIVTEEHQNELMRWRDVFRVGQFDIGDIAAEEIIRMSQSGVAATHDRIFRAIGKYCGKEGRTVRYYYETAIFFSQGVRREFDELPFSHFVLARQYKNNWRGILEYSQANMGISIAALEKWAYERRWQRPLPVGQIDVDAFPAGKLEGFKEGDYAEDKTCESTQDLIGMRVAYFSSVEIVQAYIARTKHFLGQLEEIDLGVPYKDSITGNLESAVGWLEKALAKMV